MILAYFVLPIDPIFREAKKNPAPMPVTFAAASYNEQNTIVNRLRSDS
jgi:hypothetical protein